VRLLNLRQGYGAYDIEREIKALGQSGLPRADWIAKTLLAAAPQMR
jgi:hypothetical protein